MPEATSYTIAFSDYEIPGVFGVKTKEEASALSTYDADFPITCLHDGTSCGQSIGSISQFGLFEWDLPEKPIVLTATLRLDKADLGSANRLRLKPTIEAGQIIGWIAVNH